MQYIKAYVATILTFLVVDAAWISLFLVDFYKDEIGPLMAAQPNMVAATAFYLFYAAAIVALAVKPALATNKLGTAVGLGAIVGAVCYGTFTVTNYAILEDWTLPLVASDIAWGTFLTAVCAGAGLLAGRAGDAA